MRFLKNKKQASTGVLITQGIGAEKALACLPPPVEKSSGGNPYVEFCTPGGFAPNKIIENSTHSFKHDTCVWDLR